VREAHGSKSRFRLGSGLATPGFLDIYESTNSSQQHLLAFAWRCVDYLEYRDRRSWRPNDRKEFLMRSIMPDAV